MFKVSDQSNYGDLDADVQFASREAMRCFLGNAGLPTAANQRFRIDGWVEFRSSENGSVSVPSAIYIDWPSADFLIPPSAVLNSGYFPLKFSTQRHTYRYEREENYLCVRGVCPELYGVYTVRIQSNRG